MTAIGFDPATGSLVIQGNNVFPAGSLVASVSTTWADRIQIDSLAGRGEQTVLWSDVTSLDGSFVPASMDAALAYLRGEFAKRPANQGDHAIPVSIERPGQTTIPLQQPPSRLSSVRLEVNGGVYRAPDIAVTDIAVMWLNPDFPLAPSDQISLVYS